MFRLVCFSLLVASAGASVIATGLDPLAKTKLTFYDFDKTMVINSFGETVLMSCDPNCSYAACKCIGEDDLTNALHALLDPKAAVVATFGGPDRLARFGRHLQSLKDAGVDLYIVSTSWYTVPATAWAKFIHAALKYVNLEMFYPMEKILPLADPGDGLSADKGAVITSKLTALGANPKSALFADDSSGNLLSAVNGVMDAETLYVQPRTGLSYRDMNYIESRAMTGASPTGPLATSTITRPISKPRAISATFYDFDKTMVTTSFGEFVLLKCDPACSYTACKCIGEDDLANALHALPDPKAAVVETFGGSARLQRFADHLKYLTSAGVGLYIVSTSWYSVPATAWAKFIHASLQYVGLEGYYPMKNILPLADPGEGLSGDKGTVIRSALDRMFLNAGDAIFADDSSGNYISSVSGDLAAETLYVQPRTGLSDAALNYIEQRSVGQCRPNKSPNCPLDGYYFSPNSGKCVLGKPPGGRCNAVQKCFSGQCKDRVCP